MSKHTPGPWELCRRGQLHGVRHVSDDGCPTDICRVDWFVSTGQDTRAEANGRLIAAAPELLRAAEQAEEDMTWAEAAVPGTNFQASIILLRAAIAKARGES